MSEIRLFPQQESRVESGPVRFGDDWPGLFLRGDQSFAYAVYLEMLLDGRGGPIEKACLQGLLKDLRSCIV